MIPTDHPIVRAAAEEMAAELSEATGRHHGLMSDHTEGALYEAVFDLLRDLSRPHSRDFWVRWLCERDFQRVRANTPAFVHGEAFDRGARREIASLREPLRDDPQALAAAVCAALETP